MKHLLSVLLALVMMLSVMSMLIPTATAVTSSSPLPPVGDDFEDENASDPFTEAGDSTSNGSSSQTPGSDPSGALGGTNTGDQTQGSEANEMVLFECNFNDASYANLTDEELIQAIFGSNTSLETRYVLGDNLNASIVNGALKIHAEAGGSDFVAKVVSNDAISEQGFSVECEYVFHQRTVVAGNGGEAECDSRYFGFNAKAEVSTADKNSLLAYVYNGNNSRVAYRNAVVGSWGPLVFSEDVNDSGLQETKYKLKSVFSPVHGPSLYVAKWDSVAGAYGDYVLLGCFEYDNQMVYDEYMADPTTGGENMFSDNVIMKIQHGNHVSIDNLKVTLLEKETYDLTINGESVTLEGSNRLNLSLYCEGTFRFAVVDGVVVKSNYIEVTKETEVIDVYDADLDTLDGAALITGETTAIRWMSSIKKADYDKLAALEAAGGIQSIEYGVLYVDASSFSRAEAAAGPKLDSTGVQKAAGSPVYEPGYEGLYVFNANATVTAGQYNVKLAGRAYMIITFNDDTTMLIEGDYDSGFHARSAAEIALAAMLDDENGLSEDQLAKVAEIAAAYVQ